VISYNHFGMGSCTLFEGFEKKKEKKFD